MFAHSWRGDMRDAHFAGSGGDPPCCACRPACSERGRRDRIGASSPGSRLAGAAAKNKKPGKAGLLNRRHRHAVSNGVNRYFASLAMRWVSRETLRLALLL